MKLKVCGMKYQDNIRQVAALQPDYLGFIFYKKSARHFDAESIPELPNSIKKTGVFVDANLDYVLEKISKQTLLEASIIMSSHGRLCKRISMRIRAS